MKKQAFNEQQLQAYLIIYQLLIDKIIISMISSSSKETIELEYIFLVSQRIIYNRPTYRSKTNML